LRAVHEADTSRVNVRTVQVVASDEALRSALVNRLQAADLEPAPRGGTLDHVCSPGVVVATTSDCPSERCAELAASGVRVVVLAPVPRPGERERYLRAGAAAYLPMDVDGRELVRSVRHVATDSF
jgi:DNA-binding NarL/FixJ family response regulator